MRYVRRTAQILAFVGTLLIAVLAFALIVSQTPWFKDWLRRYVIREAHQYLNGELTIGGLGGNLFYGLELTDIALRVDGQQIVTIKDVGLDFSVFEIVSSGVNLDAIRLNRPVLRLERDARGWNLARLVKKQRREADREGPARPISIGRIGISDGTVTIRDTGGATGYRLPEAIEKLNARLSFAYRPVRFTLGIHHVSFDARNPRFGLRELSGTVATESANVYLDKLSIRTEESAMSLDGVIEQYTSRPRLNITYAANKLSLPELARVVPALQGYPHQPQITLTARGPIDALVMDVNVRAKEGSARGQLTADLRSADRRLKGELDLEHLDLAPLLKDAAHRSDITGAAAFDVTLPAGNRVNGMRGPFRVNGMRASYGGFQGADIRARGRVDGRRVVIDEGRAAAYGSTATVSGQIVRPARRGDLVRYDLRGRATHVDLRRLPARLNLPRLATNLDLSAYHVTGRGLAFVAEATLAPSVIEGARFLAGTTGRFLLDGPRIEYAAKGTVEALDLQRFGRALRIDAMSADRYRSVLNGTFDVRGSGRTLESTVLDASATLADSEWLDGHIPRMTFSSHLAAKRLELQAQGAFSGFDPAVLSGNPRLAGTVDGELDARFTLASVGDALTPDNIAASGRVVLTDSDIGGFAIDAGEMTGEYANRAGRIEKLEVTGRDGTVTAAGALALGRTGASDLKYTVTGLNLSRVGTILNHPLHGSATLDGQLTGNGDELRTTGTLDATDAGYGANEALQVKSRYTVALPELQLARARVDADTQAVFVKIGGQQINQINATARYADQRITFDARLKQGVREVEGAGDIVLHPDHQEFHVGRLAIRTEGQEWRAEGGDMAVRYGQNVLVLKNVRLVSGDQRLDVTGSIALKEGGTGTLDVKAANVDLTRLEQLLLTNRQVAGRLNADVKLTGSMAAPRVDGTLTIVDGAFRQYTYQRLSATVDYTKSGMTLDARLDQNPQASITAKGYLPNSFFQTTAAEHVGAAGADAANLRIQTNAIDLALVQGLTRELSQVTGTVQADVRVTGSGRDPHLDGFVDVRNGAFKVTATGVGYTGFNTRIALTEDRIAIEAFTVLDDHGQSLRVSGNLGIHERQMGAMNVTLQAEGFEILDNELGDLDIDVNLSVTGELRRPRVEGEVALQGGRIEVDRVLDFLWERDAYASQPLAEQMVARTGPTVTVAPRMTAQSLAGQAGAPSEPPGPAPVPAPVPLPAGTPAAPAPRPSLFAGLELDVHVRMPNNLVVRGNDIRTPNAPVSLGKMNVTLGGDVRLQKLPGSAVHLAGVVNTVRGTYDFQGRRFEILRDGRIRFVGLPDFNPELAIDARRVISGVEAQVHIRGTMRQPALTLSSRPPLDEADILSLIVFNQPVNQLGEGQAVSLAERAGAMATGFVVSPIVESLGRSLDVDLFEIQTSNDAGQIGPRVTIGEQIGEKLFVKFTQQFGSDDYTQFMLEYQLASFLRLQGSISPDRGRQANRLLTRRVERFGADLIFFFSY